jgi:hypothetical protein
MLRRTLLLGALCAGTLTTASSASAAASRNRASVVISDAAGRERPADLRWTAEVVLREDGSVTPEGEVSLRFSDRREAQTWHFTAGRVEAAPQGSRRKFLQLLGTPTTPAKSSARLQVLVTPLDGWNAADRRGRVKVKFSWTVDGVGTFESKGSITVKGAKILQN